MECIKKIKAMAVIHVNNTRFMERFNPLSAKAHSKFVNASSMVLDKAVTLNNFPFFSPLIVLCNNYYNEI